MANLRQQQAQVSARQSVNDRKIHALAKSGGLKIEGNRISSKVSYRPGEVDYSRHVRYRAPVGQTRITINKTVVINHNYNYYSGWRTYNVYRAGYGYGYYRGGLWIGYTPIYRYYGGVYGYGYYDAYGYWIPMYTAADAAYATIVAAGAVAEAIDIVAAGSQDAPVAVEPEITADEVVTDAASAQETVVQAEAEDDSTAEDIDDSVQSVPAPAPVQPPVATPPAAPKSGSAW